MHYPVNEVFVTVQGEAKYTGTPCMFIRLQGCDVGCPWCDTKHTWDAVPEDEIDPSDLIAREAKDDKHWAMMDEHQLLCLVREAKVKHVVLTGGEPCDHDLHALTRVMAQDRITVQIETSGTSEIKMYDAWVTLSPKIDMPGGLKVRQDAVDRANEIKFPVGKQTDVEKLLQFLRDYKVHPRKKVWLQPLSQNPKATQLCLATCYKHNFNLSVQTHKYIGVA